MTIRLVSNHEIYDYWCKTCGMRFYSCTLEGNKHDKESNGHQVSDDIYYGDEDAPIIYITAEGDLA